MFTQKLGIIGGGQLGLLLTQAAMSFPVQVSIYDPNPHCSAAHYTRHFSKGDFDDKERLIAFGSLQDAVIFETESVNAEALIELQEKGVRVISCPKALQWIKDKGCQKEKLKKARLPILDFRYISASEIKSYNDHFPIVQKWRKGGYDGYGVQIIKTKADLKKAKEVDSIFEEMAEIEKEISVILARNELGDIEFYPPVEMVFDPVANLIDYLIAPANLSLKKRRQILHISKEAAEKLKLVGLYAIEFFMDKKGKFYINEIAPRTHNSGHHTINGNITSQYEQQIRMALGLPLGSTKQIIPCLMLNLLADNTKGRTSYKGIEEAFAIPNVQYTLYGKEEVKPGRKMGHAIIMEKTIEKAIEKMNDVRKKLLITSHE
jgi:5-(carboxyamino)imidazole ribonucleotide synthase